MSVDPISLAVLKSLFASVAEEMGVTLQRASFSPNIKERLDYSCALFDAGARMVAQAAHIPVHLGSMPASVAAAIASVGAGPGAMAPGDVILLNDPYHGGTHLPDVTMVSPVFVGGAPRFYVASRAHHAWSAQPWTTRFGFPVPGRPAPLHPNADGMRAVADLVVAEASP